MRSDNWGAWRLRGARQSSQTFKPFCQVSMPCVFCSLCVPAAHTRIPAYPLHASHAPASHRRLKHRSPPSAAAVRVPCSSHASHTANCTVGEPAARQTGAIGNGRLICRWQARRSFACLCRSCARRHGRGRVIGAQVRQESPIGGIRPCGEAGQRCTVQRLLVGICTRHTARIT